MKKITITINSPLDSPYNGKTIKGYPVGFGDGEVLIVSKKYCQHPFSYFDVIETRTGLTALRVVGRIKDCIELLKKRETQFIKSEGSFIDFIDRKLKQSEAE